MHEALPGLTWDRLHNEVMGREMSLDRHRTSAARLSNGL